MSGFLGRWLGRFVGAWFGGADDGGGRGTVTVIDLQRFSVAVSDEGCSDVE